MSMTITITKRAATITTRRHHTRIDFKRVKRGLKRIFR